MNYRWSCVPHACGDEPYRASGSSGLRVEVFPTRVGMNRRASPSPAVFPTRVGMNRMVEAN